MNIKYSLLLFLGMCVSFTFSSCNGKSNKKQAHTVNIDVYTAQQKVVPYRYTFISETSSNLDFTIEPRVNGYLISKNYGSGKPVEKGDLLFEIESQPYQINLAKSRANVASAKASFSNANSVFQRTEPLAAIQAVSQSDLDAARADLVAAREQVNVAMQQYNDAELQVGYTKIYAPHKGIGSSSNAVIGDYVGVGTNFSVLATISYIDSIAVDLSFPMMKYLDVVGKNGIYSPTYKNSNLLTDIKMELSDGSIYPIDGVYNYTKTDVDNNSDAIVFQVLFPNLSYVLKSGQFVRVTATIGDPIDVVVVPQVCVSQTQNLYNIWVVAPDSTVSFRTVTLGDINGDNYIIKSGLKAGEKVAANGFFKMRNGEKVNPKNI